MMMIVGRGFAVRIVGSLVKEIIRKLRIIVQEDYFYRQDNMEL